MYSTLKGNIVARTEVRLAQYGMGMTDAEIVEWLVAEGDTIAAEQPLVLVEAAKTNVEVQAPASGTLVSILVPEGEIAEVGDVLAVIES